MKTLIIDNYDSFTYNLYQYIGALQGNPVIHRNDKITLAQIKKLKPDRIIISPGPGNPEDPAYFGVCLDAILKLGPTIPLLGVCLGHQGIIYAFGGRVIKAAEIMHGKTSIISHNQKDIFQNVQNPLKGMRYHSLVGSPINFPKELEITAEVIKKAPEAEKNSKISDQLRKKTSQSKKVSKSRAEAMGKGHEVKNKAKKFAPNSKIVIMGVRHRQYPIFGIQFHPESIGTHEGKKILKNFLEL